MCGICGIAFSDGSKPDPERLRQANALLAHRGPDDEGYFEEGPAALAMRRLAIIDLAGGRQPISWENGAYWVVLNGEIYNFQELRSELEARGRRFRTRSDTETLVALYAEYGEACLQKLRGMFAFAIWDAGRRRLFLARDRVGKKPLLYAEGPHYLAFASELRSIFALADVPRDLDEEALDLYLSLQYIPSPKTIYKKIRKLEPGCYLVYDNGRVAITRYWDLPLGRPPATRDPREAMALIREKLAESVRLRLISDVPLGAFLSGGIDSSVVVALMSELSSKPVKTFSIGFEEEAFSELPFARAVAERYGCEHTEFIVKPQMAEILPRLAWHYGEPYADASALPSYYVSRETRRHVTVALNGDGGDENFAGYVRYFAMNLTRYFDLLPPPARRALSEAAGMLPEADAPYGFFWRLKRFLRSTLSSDLPSRHLRMVCYFPEDDKTGLYDPGFLSRLGKARGSALGYLEAAFDRARGEDFVNRLLYADFRTYLPECLMVKMDIASMANSLEARSPLLDHEFIDLVYRLPGRWKLRGLKGHKWIFKEAFKDKLPPMVYRRGKMGFGIPLGPWFRGPLKGYWQDHVLSPEALGRGYFRAEALRKLWAEHQEGRRDHGYRLWSLLMLELWHRHA